ncbi:M23 family metallopeptidase [Dendrosporobacter sp. 1207_IL3150]|uniref:M23 family metallopeptidase n=1 Tax=Dendrosporobacter sp. 1207_IL3150 TaxID=3084054 RepID=UPI002FD8B5EF
MAKQWNNWKNYWETKDNNWQYREEEVDYAWLKRTIIAVIIFTVAYGAHVSETMLGRMVDNGVRYMVNTQTDFAYVFDQIINHTPKNIDVSVLKRAQSVVTKPADPLMYMNKPVNGKVISGFGWRTHPVLKQEMMHEGVEFEAQLGTSVRSSASGTVKTIADSAQHGKTIVLEHGQEIETVYGHLGEVLVKQGDAVSQGQVIAKSGKSGIVSGPMLYFEMREKGKAIDPLSRIKGEFPTEGGK